MSKSEYTFNIEVLVSGMYAWRYDDFDADFDI
jgi:hypothetical protein